jgi:hypothetical protein
MSGKKSNLIETTDLNVADAVCIDLMNVVLCDLRLLSRISCAQISERLDNIVLFEIQSI